MTVRTLKQKLCLGEIIKVAEVYYVSEIPFLTKDSMGTPSSGDHLEVFVNLIVEVVMSSILLARRPAAMFLCKRS